jgi:hypothetical protein
MTGGEFVGVDVGVDVGVLVGVRVLVGVCVRVGVGVIATNIWTACSIQKLFESVDLTRIVRTEAVNVPAEFKSPPVVKEK